MKNKRFMEKHILTISGLLLVAHAMPRTVGQQFPVEQSSI